MEQSFQIQLLYFGVAETFKLFLSGLSFKKVVMTYCFKLNIKK